MADVAQLVRALDCGSGGRGFETHHSPQNKILTFMVGFLLRKENKYTNNERTHCGVEFWITVESLDRSYHRPCG